MKVLRNAPPPPTPCRDNLHSALRKAKRHVGVNGNKIYSPLFEIRQQVVDEFALQKYLPTADISTQQIAETLFSIPWGHHVQIINRCKGNMPKALFFVRKTRENNWSRAVLLNFLDTDLYERDGKAITNFNVSLPAPESDLAQQMTKDPYCFDFLTLSQQYSEKELKDALMTNIPKIRKQSQWQSQLQ